MLSAGTQAHFVLTLQSMPPFVVESILVLALAVIMAIPLILQVQMLFDGITKATDPYPAICQNDWMDAEYRDVVTHYPATAILDTSSGSSVNMKLMPARNACSTPMFKSELKNAEDTRVRMPILKSSSSFVITNSVLPVVDISAFNYGAYRHKMIEANLKKQYGDSQPPGNVVLNSIHLNSIDSNGTVRVGDATGSPGFIDSNEERCGGTTELSRKEIEFLHPLDHFLIKGSKKSSTVEMATGTKEFEDALSELVDFDKGVGQKNYESCFAKTSNDRTNLSSKNIKMPTEIHKVVLPKSKHGSKVDFHSTTKTISKVDSSLKPGSFKDSRKSPVSFPRINSVSSAVRTSEAKEIERSNVQSKRRKTLKRTSIRPATSTESLSPVSTKRSPSTDQEDGESFNRTSFSSSEAESSFHGSTKSRSKSGNRIRFPANEFQVGEQLHDRSIVTIEEQIQALGIDKTSSLIRKPSSIKNLTERSVARSKSKKFIFEKSGSLVRDYHSNPSSTSGSRSVTPNSRPRTANPSITFRPRSFEGSIKSSLSIPESAKDIQEPIANRETSKHTVNPMDSDKNSLKLQISKDNAASRKYSRGRSLDPSKSRKFSKKSPTPRSSERMSNLRIDSSRSRHVLLTSSSAFTNSTLSMQPPVLPSSNSSAVATHVKANTQERVVRSPERIGKSGDSEPAVKSKTLGSYLRMAERRRTFLGNLNKTPSKSERPRTAGAETMTEAKIVTEALKSENDPEKMVTPDEDQLLNLKIRGRDKIDKSNSKIRNNFPRVQDQGFNPEESQGKRSKKLMKSSSSSINYKDRYVRSMLLGHEKPKSITRNPIIVNRSQNQRPKLLATDGSVEITSTMLSNSLSNSQENQKPMTSSVTVENSKETEIKSISFSEDESKRFKKKYPNQPDSPEREAKISRVSKPKSTKKHEKSQRKSKQSGIPILASNKINSPNKSKRAKKDLLNLDSLNSLKGSTKSKLLIQKSLRSYIRRLKHVLTDQRKDHNEDSESLASLSLTDAILPELRSSLCSSEFEELERLLKRLEASTATHVIGREIEA
ncbi:AF4/FMR2 family member 4-like [Cephus cinctus]|uniref:AF4/FMR2 family member 4-like n=1 Tax=Cephus cinctus TaxID=211228 RepID=A0AAJ7RSJ1_CEPCN|nr:AF4/FMR2 family member 4-like [Cephus cinctus]